MEDRGQQLDRGAFAAHLGVDPGSVTRGVREGRYPEPDGHLGGRPWWWEATVKAFDPPKAGRPFRQVPDAQAAHEQPDDHADGPVTSPDA